MHQAEFQQNRVQRRGRQARGLQDNQDGPEEASRGLEFPLSVLQRFELDQGIGLELQLYPAASSAQRSCRIEHIIVAQELNLGI